LVSVLNYANLATAQAALHAKEVGMRKVLGAGRVTVIVQSLVETLIQGLVALALALVILALLAPLIRGAAEVDVLYFLAQGPRSAGLILALVVVVALIAGAYPALVLSGVRPAQALQSGRSRTGPKLVSRILVGLQFATASFLLIMLTVSQAQRSHLEATALAPRQDPIVVLNDIQALDIGPDALVTALSQARGVKSVTLTDRPPWSLGGSLMPLTRSPDAAATQQLSFLRHVGYDYFQTLGLKPLAGRLFDRQHETGPSTLFQAVPGKPVGMIVDQAMSETLGFATPTAAIDKIVYVPETITRLGGGTAAAPLRIVGVVETDVTRVGASAAHGHMYMYAPNSPFGNGLFPIVRLSRDDLAGSLKAITQAWDAAAPNIPVDVQFFDQLFEQSYRNYQRAGQLFTGLALITLIIAAIGQLAMAVHVAASRRHEIAVRKTLGSSTAEAVRLLIADFSKPVIVGNLIAWPLAYFAAQAFLQVFAQRIELTAWPFVISLGVTLVIAWLAVGGQTLDAARVSPAKVLREQ
jgi:putative ABC transport system permease protein